MAHISHNMAHLLIVSDISSLVPVFDQTHGNDAQRAGIYTQPGYSFVVDAQRIRAITKRGAPAIPLLTERGMNGFADIMLAAIVSERLFFPCE